MGEQREDDAPPASGYEFSQLENQAFTRLAGAMQLVALLEVACGVLIALVALPLLAEAISAGALLRIVTSSAYMGVPVLIGLWTFRAGGHLRSIVRTEGDA